METTLERLEPVKVKVTVSVEPDRVAEAFDKAAKKLAGSLQIPGFRKGKAPRRVLESHIGKDAIREQAIEDSLSRFYVEALEAEDLLAVANPELDLKLFDETDGCTFEATVEVRPQFDLPDHEGIAVKFPDWEVTDELLDEQLEAIRERFAELDEVDRPAADGDYVTLDLEVTQDGVPIEDAAVRDALYEVGSAGVTPKLDEHLIGASAGDELTYDDKLPDEYPHHGGEQVTFIVSVQDVRAKELPALDDDFAESASEFDTLAELRDDITTNLRRQTFVRARQELRAQVVDAYLAGIDIPLPPTMIEGDRHDRLHTLEHEAQRYGRSVEELLELQGTNLEDFTAQATNQARASVKARLVLDELARRLNIQVSSEDVNNELFRHALTRGVEPEQLAKTIQEQGTLPVLVGDILRSKAIDALVDAADVEGLPSEEVVAQLAPTPPPVSSEADVEATDPAAMAKAALALAAADAGTFQAQETFESPEQPASSEAEAEPAGEENPE